MSVKEAGLICLLRGGLDLLESAQESLVSESGRQGTVREARKK